MARHRTERARSTHPEQPSDTRLSRARTAGTVKHSIGPAIRREAWTGSGPAPDPEWDDVTLASWESFPASDAPGWR